MASDNKDLGEFVLSGIPSAPRGVPQIEVTFDIDASGVLHVTAKDKGTGKEQKITIQGSTGMDDKEVDRLVKEAEANREADKKKKESIEARNHADSSIYQAEKTMKDSEGKFDAALGTEATAKIEELRKVLAEADASKEAIDTAMNPLNEVMMKIGQEIYAKGGTPEGDDGVKVKDTNEKKDDGTVDAEVEEK
jgi:molecular chaperone DnaK